jgi:FAD/FMN-containing dehydrogenase
LVAHSMTEAASPKEMNRREFLTLCGMGTVAGILAACDAQTPGPHLRDSPTRQPSPTNADWSALARALQGTLVRPGSPQYPTAHQLFSTRFDHILPAAIAYCASPTDVQTCLAFARRFGIALAPRSGGHSYAGYSTTSGLVVDITRMNAVSVNASTGVATVGAGARLIDVYAALAQHGLVLPAGSCATVGIAGLTMGGGIGVLGRKFGLTCDNLQAAQVVVADGRLLTCNANHEPDLFWALRGGGGGNFGVVTSFTFQAHPVSTQKIITLRGARDSAPGII